MLAWVERDDASAWRRWRDRSLDGSRLVAVAGETGVVGFARRDDVLGSGDAPFPSTARTFGPSLEPWCPVAGSCRSALTPEPCQRSRLWSRLRRRPRAPTGRVTLYVRNDASEVMWVAIDGQAIGSIGFLAQNLGVGCLEMAAGSSLVVMDRSPAAAGARSHRRALRPRPGTHADAPLDHGRRGPATPARHWCSTLVGKSHSHVERP